MIAPADAVVVGVDGARRSWVAAVHVAGTAPTLHWCPDMDDVVALARCLGASLVGIDMPIGLPAVGPRASDSQARAVLGPRRSCLFPTPVRAVLDATDHADAVRRSRAVCGKGISIQAWNLVPSIVAARTAVALAPDIRIVEVHPETSFAVMAGAPLVAKHLPEGAVRRTLLLEVAFPGLDIAAAAGSLIAGASINHARAPRRFGLADLLDALAACWSVRRLTLGEASILGEGVDDDGFTMTLVV